MNYCRGPVFPGMRGSESLSAFRAAGDRSSQVGHDPSEQSPFAAREAATEAAHDGAAGRRARGPKGLLPLLSTYAQRLE